MGTFLNISCVLLLSLWIYGAIQLAAFFLGIVFWEIGYPQFYWTVDDYSYRWEVYRFRTYHNFIDYFGMDHDHPIRVARQNTVSALKRTIGL